MATTDQKHLEESIENQILSEGINQIEQGICKIITGFGKLEQKLHSETDKDYLETLKATISTLEAEKKEQDLLYDNKIRQLSQEKKRLLNGFVSEKNEMMNEKELLMEKIAALCEDNERNELVWKKNESQLKQLIAQEKRNTQDALDEIEKLQMKDEMGKSQTKALEKKIESQRIELNASKEFLKRSEDAWQKEEKKLQDIINVEKKNCQRALEASYIFQAKEKGFEKEMERKRKVVEENSFLENENHHLKEDLHQKSTAYEIMTGKVKEKDNEIKSINTRNKHSNDKLNNEIRTLKESLIETENRFTTLQETYDKTKERLCKAEEHVAIVKDEADRQYTDDEYRTDRRNASTMDNRSNSKRYKMILESTVNFGRHRDTFRIARNNQERSKLMERLKEMEDGQKVQQTVLEQMEKRALSTEQQLKDKQKEIEYFERTIERLQTECKGSKLSLESEQEKMRRLESRMKTSKQLEEDNRELYLTIVKIKKETVDSEKRLQENAGFHTQELILMNRLKELLGSMQTNGKYEFNSSNQRIIKSYNINNSQVFFNNKSLIRHGNSEDG